jgi:Icc protein
MSTSKIDTLHGINPFDRLKYVFDYLNDDNYSFIIVTGDVSNSGDVESYHQFLEISKTISCKIIVIPGNHDNKENIKIFNNYENILLIEDGMNFEIDGWSFFHLNTIIDGKHHGRIKESDIEGFNKYKNSIDKFYNICIIMHHNPLAIGNLTDKYKIENFQDISHLFCGNVKLVIYGHVHNDHSFNEKGVIYTSCPSSSFQTRKMSIDTSVMA